MAAPCRAWRVFQLTKNLRQAVDYQLYPAASWLCQAQQARHKKGLQQAKQPHIAQDKGKWIPRNKRVEKTLEVDPWEGKYETHRATDDVWIRENYPPPLLTFLEAVKRHREYAQPALLDNPNGMIHATFDLDLRTRKKTKFMNALKKTVKLPHNFDDGSVNRVLAFCASSEEREKALEAGALQAGSLELMKLLMNGELTSDDYEHVVATGDMIQEMLAVKKYLRDRFPSKPSGTLGPDIVHLVEHFVNGKTYEMEKLVESRGRVKVVIGTLDMSSESLQENFNSYVESLCASRSADLGPFILKTTIECPPSHEVFLLDKRETLPLAQRSKPIVTELVQEEEPAPEVDSDDEAEVSAQAKK